MLTLKPRWSYLEIVIRGSLRTAATSKVDVELICELREFIVIYIIDIVYSNLYKKALIQALQMKLFIKDIFIYKLNVLRTYKPIVFFLVQLVFRFFSCTLLFIELKFELSRLPTV